MPKHVCRRKNASTKLAGEFIGILSGADPEEVKAGYRRQFVI